MRTINPATEEVLAEYEVQGTETTMAQIEEATEAFQHWRQTDLDVRLQCVRDFAEALHAARMPLAELMTREMGKVLKESLSEVDKCADSCKTIAERYPKWKAEI